MATIEEETWMGRSFAVDDDSGGTRFLATQSIWGRTSPLERIWHVNVNFVLNSHYTMVLPDARTVPRGGPHYHFIVTADPMVPFVRWVTNGLAGFIDLVPPVAIKWYLADDLDNADGLWCFKATGFLFHTESDPALIASFGASIGTGAIDKYSVIADSWSTEPDSGEDWYRAGVSWTGDRALIRKADTVWSHLAGTTTFQSASGLANIDSCSFIRTSGNVIGSRHYAFGNFDLGSHVSDYYEFGGNSFTLIPSNATVGWSEGGASAVAGDQSSDKHHIIQILQHSDTFLPLYPTWLFNVQSAAYFAIQPTSVPHYQWGPLVTLKTRVHLMGGATTHSASSDVGTRWHHTYIVELLSGWLTRPWIPKPLRGHGLQYLPNRGGERRCLFTMGKDHSFFPSDNVDGHIYDDVSEAYTVAGSSAWTDRQEQNNSWGHLD